MAIEPTRKMRSTIVIGIRGCSTGFARSTRFAFRRELFVTIAFPDFVARSRPGMELRCASDAMIPRVGDGTLRGIGDRAYVVRGARARRVLGRLGPCEARRTAA